MIGGCLDSWHAGNGAVDNAAGAAVLLEAMRILKSLNVPLRRTVRIALWSAEEQGHLGSDAYVKQLGDGGRRISAYFNVDYGPGKIRGIYLQQNQEVRPIFQAWLAPLADLGASTLVPGNIGSTDHIPFDAVGIPAFQFLRDFMEGAGGVEHTNMDTYDHVNEDDLKQAAAVVAAFAYNAAMRDQMLPRKK
jgi:Zn-dependent M28 family amino/carboxypeptidase